MDSNNTSPFCVKIKSSIFASVNVPVSVSCLLLNIFYFFCMIFPQKGTEILKQPLKAFLGSLLRCNIIIHITILAMVFTNYFLIQFESYIVLSLPSIVIYTMMVSMNSSHWLNVFYCFQIIPVRRPYFIWFKRNMKVFVFCSAIFNATVCLLGLSVNTALLLIHNNDKLINRRALEVTEDVTVWIRLNLYFISLFTMLGSSCLTVLFLWKHMKNMEKSSGFCSSPRRHRQIRNAIVSISRQALIHTTCSTFVIIDEFINLVSIFIFDNNRNILCTVISFYSFATTVNLGINQSVFRQRAVCVWRKIFRPCSSLSALTEIKSILSNRLSSYV